MVVSAKGSRVDAALTLWFTVSSSRLGVSAERMGRCAGTVVNSSARSGVPIGRPVPRVGGTSAFAVNSTGSSPASVVVVPVVKRAAPGVVVVVVIVYVSVVPIASPMIPAPSPTSEPTDSKADSEPEGGAVIPDSGIRVPTRPRHDGISINHPRIVRGDVNHLGVSRLNDDRRVLRGYGLLRRGLEIAGFLRPLAHHLYGIHHILSLVVVGVA